MPIAPMRVENNPSHTLTPDRYEESEGSDFGEGDSDEEPRKSPPSALTHVTH